MSSSSSYQDIHPANRITAAAAAAAAARLPASIDRTYSSDRTDCSSSTTADDHHDEAPPFALNDDDHHHHADDGVSSCPPSSGKLVQTSASSILLASPPPPPRQHQSSQDQLTKNNTGSLFFGLTVNNNENNDSSSSPHESGGDHTAETSPLSPPGLVESMMTDGSQSAQSSSSTTAANDHHNHQQERPSRAEPLSSTFLMSSLHTIHSDAGDITLAPSTVVGGGQNGSNMSATVTSSRHHPHSPPSIVRGLSPSMFSSSSLLSSNLLQSPPTRYASNPTGPAAPMIQQPNPAVESSTSSVGFSQLLEEADNTYNHTKPPPSKSVTMTASKTSMMPPVPEDRPSASETNNGTRDHRQQQTENKRSISFANGAKDELGTPLLSSTATIIPAAPAEEEDENSNRTTTTHVTRLLSNNNNGNNGNTPRVYSPLDRAKTSVQVYVHNDEFFEVSMMFEDTSLSHSISVDDVMKIVANPDLLRLWCDPIETLIVTSNSSSSMTEGTSSVSSASSHAASPQRINDRGGGVESGDVDNSNGNTSSSPDRPVSAREYEGEWIEATTTALDSPPSSGVGGYMYQAGQSLMESLGFASYGRITMFVERKRGHVSLTIGPFYGGIYATHSVRVLNESGNNLGINRVRVVDRVRLKRSGDHDGDLGIAGLFGCGVFESCLSQCVLPSVDGYVEQVRTSLGRLRLLVESGAMINVDKLPVYSSSTNADA
eukprot:CAMPEP_0113459876 /NCGR_PEP_ID=MMETSP0014_2-20120614/10691_1 /TAXON_ID=2857 /ORGANISM="Nitzschia sp." /LENGTH=715 /DNA_ID=CAMNT_0000351499 /DNA_START=260 /DNA_END=2405 /DNA_ORIENTATION=+ /assembly_acc=CAM_ASM_000159